MRNIVHTSRKRLNMVFLLTHGATSQPLVLTATYRGLMQEWSRWLDSNQRLLRPEFGSQKRHDNLSTTYASRPRAIVTEKDRKSVFWTGSGYEMATLEKKKDLGEVATYAGLPNSWIRANSCRSVDHQKCNLRVSVAGVERPLVPYPPTHTTTAGA